MDEYLAPDTLSDLIVVTSLQELDDGAHSHSHACTRLGFSDADADS